MAFPSSITHASEIFKIKAFTLAEVLITLLIVGVVAAMIVPGLYKSILATQYKTQLKRTYSLISKALKSREVDCGTAILPAFINNEYCSFGQQNNVVDNERSFANQFSKQFLSLEKVTGIDNYIILKGPGLTLRMLIQASLSNRITTPTGIFQVIVDLNGEGGNCKSSDITLSGTITSIPEHCKTPPNITSESEIKEVCVLAFDGYGKLLSNTIPTSTFGPNWRNRTSEIDIISGKI